MTVDLSTPALSLVGRGPSRPAASSRTSPAPSGNGSAGCSAADAVAARTLQILRRAGIQSIVIRPATAGPQPARSSRRSAVDLLVAPWAVASAQLLLRHHEYSQRLQGVRAGEDPREVSAWTVPERPELTLNLYCGFAGVDDPERFFTEMWKSRRVVPLAGVDVCVPGAGGTALLLLLRAAVPGCPADRLAEIRSAATTLDTVAWVEASVLAGRAGARAAAAAGAAVAVPVGTLPLATEPRPDSPARWLRGCDDPPSGADQDAVPSRPGWAGPARKVVRQVLPGLRLRFPPLG